MLRFPIAVAVLLALPAALPAQQPERYTIDEGSAAVYNLVGNVRIEPWDGAVTVQVTRAGAQASQLKVEHGEMTTARRCAWSTPPTGSDRAASRDTARPSSGCATTAPSATMNTTTGTGITMAGKRAVG